MRYILLIAMLSVLCGCTTETQYGQCIGAFDDKDPSLVYKVSVGNVVWGVLLAETIVVPVVVIADESLCPVMKKELKS